jgi:hypothetical protein
MITTLAMVIGIALVARGFRNALASRLENRNRMLPP